MKVFASTFTQTAKLSRMKVFARLFQKAAGFGAEPRDTAFLWFFLCAYLLKERTEKIFSMLHVLIHSILFFDTAGAKKRIKRNAVLRGVAPNPSRFLKKATQKLS
ncbi:MAG: hypothetical protein E7594_06460 [Ruminococcaceae bacterium]|nr:hypothetical protein [Oscillospiraceae bacterium]